MSRSDFPPIENTGPDEQCPEPQGQLDKPLDIVQQLRNRRELVDWGNGNVTDEPDGLCEEAANEIERLRAEVIQRASD